MDAELTDTKNFQLMLGDNARYTYTVRLVEITNALGFVIATVDEYSITNGCGEIYKLYKTREGNWYDLPESGYANNKTVTKALKSAIDDVYNLRGGQ